MVIVDRVVVQGDTSHQDRALIDLADLMTVEDEGMQGLFKLWREMRLGAKQFLPTIHDIRWQPLLDLQMQHRVNIIDVGADSPTAYRIDMQALVAYRRSGVNLRGTYLGEHTDLLHSEGLQRDFLAVKDRQAPRYHHICNRVDGRWRSYRRLILPFAGPDGRKVEKLMIGIRTGAPTLVERAVLA